MGRRHRHRGPAEAAPGRENSLLDAIADGELDDHLTALADAIEARRRLLHTVRSTTALSKLCVGDLVRINDAVSPQYLIGLHCEVVAVDERTATVRLPRPVGRFRSGTLRCPPLALDKPADAGPRSNAATS